MKKLLTLLVLCAASCSPLPAQNTIAGNLTVQQALKLTGSASPAQLTANANDYAPAGFASAAVLRLESDVPRTITGLAGGAAGRMVWLTNVGSQTISLATESSASSAANRFAFGASGFDLPAGGSLSIWYDTTSSRWRSATNLAAGGGGTTVDQTARDAAAAAQATADSKQPALANAATLAKVTESAGLPLWDGAAWPGGGSGGTGTVTNVSVVSANGVSGSVANASTTPAITLALGAIAPTSVAATGTVTGSNLSGTNTGDQTNVSGNAGTATKLATARAINGVSFDGTANITVPAAAGTLTGSTLASGVTASSLTSAAGGTFGTAAFTAATAYDPAGAAAAITLAGLGGVPTSRTVNGHALSSNVSVTAGDVGLGSVENTALSTWAGTHSITTLGTITAGTWHGTAIADSYISSAPAWNAKVSFPGFGTTAGTAAEGNDSRLSDARTPLAHTQAWSTITSTPTTLAGYAISDAQPLDSDLTSIAALATTTFGRSLLTQADAAAARATLGAGTSSFSGAYSSLTGIPSTFAPSAHSQTVSTISDSTTVGQNLVKLTNPGAVAFPRLNADNTVSALDAASFRTAIGVSGGSGDVSGPASSSDNAITRFDGTGGKTVQNSASYIDDSGNIGIGTASPVTFLHILGTRPCLALQATGVTAKGRFFEADNNAAGRLDLTSNLSYDGTSWQRDDTSQNSTQVKLIAGSFNVLYVTAGANPATPVSAFLVTSAGAVQFSRYGAGTLVTDSSGNITASSDARLKNVSGKFTRGLDSILQIQPKVFTWKPESGMNSTDVNVGFIAQDVQPAIPEAVGVDPQGMLTISDRPLIAALVNAVKELKAENDELRKRLDKMETKK